MQDQELMATMRQISRERIHEIWQRVKQGRPQDGPEEATIAKVMKDHPRYYRYWEKAAEYEGKLLTDKKGANPFLHLAFEAALESQLQSGEIPEVKLALQSVVESGVDRHEARHRILSILVEETWRALERNQPFDSEAYKRKLRRLAERD